MNSKQAEIAIMMPAYNAAAYLAQAIESVVAQTFPRWTLTIVDDGSTDDTASIAEEFAESDERIHLRRQPNAGVSAARNHGYAMVPREIERILFLDADDELEPGALETLGIELTASPDASAAYGLARFIDECGVLVSPGELEDYQRLRMGVQGGRVVPWPIDCPTTFEVEAVMEYIISSGSVLLRRDAIDRAGLFHTDLRLWEDWDFLAAPLSGSGPWHSLTGRYCVTDVTPRRHRMKCANWTRANEKCVGDSSLRWRMILNCRMSSNSATNIIDCRSLASVSDGRGRLFPAPKSSQRSANSATPRSTWRVLSVRLAGILRFVSRHHCRDPRPTLPLRGALPSRREEKRTYPVRAALRLPRPTPRARRRHPDALDYS